METSALNNNNVEKAFTEILKGSELIYLISRNFKKKRKKEIKLKTWGIKFSRRKNLYLVKRR